MQIMQQQQPAMLASYAPQQTQGNVLCCLCGTAIPPNPAGMCAACLRGQVDITEGIQKQLSILWCKNCGRYLQPPKHWLKAELESKELLTFCIKKVRGLSKVKLVDAGFVWTEPHSRRIKVKLTVQAEVLNGAILQQAFVVDFTVEPHMCPDCARHAANPNTWQACVQLRQHVHHKRTFFYLEQLILKHNAHANCTNVREMHEGVDFYFSNRAHAVKMIDFLQSVVPIKFRHDKQLVSHDSHNNTYNYKYTFSVEIVPICKDDLLFLPARMASHVANIGPLVLCSRVTNAITYTDPCTKRSATTDGPLYWRYPLRPLCSQKQLVSFMVLDIEPIEQPSTSYGTPQGSQTGGTHGRFILAEAQVARMSDFGVNDRTFYVRTHLGHILHPGDIALGYDLSTANLVDDDLEKQMNKGWTLPDVVLVRKSYEEKRRKRNRQRTWKIKRIDMDVDDSVVAGKRGEPVDHDMERFLEELEEDEELRQKVVLYKDHAAIQQKAQQQQWPSLQDIPEADDSENDDDLPQIPLDELLDDLEAMTLDEGAQHGGYADNAGDTEGGHVEDDEHDGMEE